MSTVTENQKDILLALGNAAGEGFTTTDTIASFVGRSVDTTCKALKVARSRGLVAAKVLRHGQHHRYQWRLSARGKKVVGFIG